jgi:hypothetical protein
MFFLVVFFGNLNRLHGNQTGIPAKKFNGVALGSEPARKLC